LAQQTTSGASNVTLSEQRSASRMGEWTCISSLEQRVSRFWIKHDFSRAAKLFRMRA
jgi:hypothetical protein